MGQRRMLRLHCGHKFTRLLQFTPSLVAALDQECREKWICFPLYRAGENPHSSALCHQTHRQAEVNQCKQFHEITLAIQYRTAAALHKRIFLLVFTYMATNNIQVNPEQQHTSFIFTTSHGDMLCLVISWSCLTHNNSIITSPIYLQQIRHSI